MEYGGVFDDVTFRRCVCQNSSPSFQSCSARQKISQLSASGALKLGLDGPPNSCAVAEIHKSVVNDSTKFQQRDLLSFFLEQVREAALIEHTPGGCPIWPIPLEGLCYSLDTESTKALLAKGPGSDKLATKIHGVLPSVIDMIWRDLDYLKIRGSQRDSVRSTTTWFLETVLSHGQLKRYFLCDRSVDIIWVCWLAMESLSIQKHTPVTSRFIPTELVGALAGNYDQLARVTRRLLKTTTLGHVAARITFWLTDDLLIDERLTQEMHAINTLLSALIAVTIVEESSPKLTEPFLQDDTHLHILSVMHRQLASENHVLTLSVVLSGAIMLSKVITASGRHGPDVIYELLSKPFVPQLFSGILLFLTMPDPPSLLLHTFGHTLDAWDQLLNHIKHATICRQDGCWLEGSPKLLDLARQIFELILHETAPGILEAPAVSKLGSRIVKLWEDHVIFYGITEGTVLERYKLLKKCCNPTCAHRLKRVRKMKKFRCSACHTVFYCSRACQKLDWRTHRPNCDSSGFATHESLQQMYEEPPTPLQISDHVYSYAPLDDPLVRHCHHIRLRPDSLGF